jgi:hypothetical protein
MNMKTPRQILLDHAASAQPRLDYQRQSWVDQLKHQQMKASSPPTLSHWLQFILFHGWIRAGQELFWIPRRAWMGLVSVWIILLLVHWGDRPEAASFPHTARVPWTQVMRIWQEQYRLAGDDSTRNPAVNSLPDPMINGPRSQRQQSLRLVAV